jgi:hypothetical protein
MHRAWRAVGLILAATIAVTVPATQAAATTTRFTAGAFQVATTQGAAGDFLVKQPFLATNDLHSLISLRLLSDDARSAIEVGYTVDRGMNGDATPHLLIRATVNRMVQCNGCGFVDAGGSIRPGSPASVGFSYFLKVQHESGGWSVLLTGSRIGSFPDSLFGGTFTRTHSVEWVGEVLAGSSIPCTEMGSGAYPPSPDAASISSISYVSGPPVNLATWEDNHGYYQVGVFNGNTVRLGGLGACNSPI